MNKRKKLIIITGPTASGKSDLAIDFAHRYKSPIVSCDSRQIYKELLIGTAPPTPEQLAEIKHYFIFSHSIFDHYTAGKYELEALSLLNELFENHNTLIMAGGSGLYIDALCKGIDDFPATDLVLRKDLCERLKEEGLEKLRLELESLDPESYNIIDKANPQRVIRALEVCIATGKKFSSFKTASAKKREFEIEYVVTNISRDALYDRINKRVDKMMENGLLKEA
jgi:tRNA dimethylallyltransferase